MSEYIKKEDILDASKIVYIEYLEIDDEGYIEGDADYFPVVFKKDIEKLSTIDIDTVERKHGEWILKQEYDICEEDGEKFWECSLCGCGSDSYDTTYHTNFCPNVVQEWMVKHEL